MRFIKNEPEILKPILIVSTISLFGLPFVSQLPIFAAEVLNMDARGLGYLMGASGTGALIAALILASANRGPTRSSTIYISALAFPACVLLFALSRSYYLSMVLMFVAGLSVVGFLANANSTIQLKTPDNLRGRVMSVYTLMFLGMTPIGHTMMGSAAHKFGTVSAVQISSALCLFITCMILFIRRDRG